LLRLFEANLLISFSMQPEVHLWVVLFDTFIASLTEILYNSINVTIFEQNIENSYSVFYLVLGTLKTGNF